MTARLLGLGLLALGGWLLGRGRTGRERRRAELLRELSAGLGLLSDELTERFAPLPEILERLGDRPFFGLLSAAFGTEPTEQLWRRAAGALPISPEDRAELAALAPIIGRYDARRQAAEIALVRRRLDRSREAAEARLARLGGIPAALGAAAGALAGIMLL